MTSKSRKMLVVVMIGWLLPALASGALLIGYNCGNGMDYSDDLALTQQGINMMSTWANMKLIALSPDWNDKDTSCLTLSVVNKQLVLSFKVNGAAKTASGTMKVVHTNGRNNYIDVNFPAGAIPADTFGVLSSGNMKLYIRYLSETEIAVRTCRDGFFISYGFFYVFSSHDYSGYSSSCITDTSSKLDTSFSIQAAPTCAQ